VVDNSASTSAILALSTTLSFADNSSPKAGQLASLLHCPKYQNIRNSYNTLFQSIRTDDDLIREILDPKDLFKTKQIFKFLKEANNIRNA
jgi:hypothetical protein